MKKGKDMAAKYHVNPSTGDARQCRAKTKPCPFGGAEAHFDSAEQARNAYEATQQVLPKRVLRKDPREPLLLTPPACNMPESWLLESEYTLDTCTDAYQQDYYSSEWEAPTEIDVEKAVGLFIGLDPEKWPEDLRMLVEDKEEWKGIHNWDFESGYYEGDGPSFYAPVNFKADLRDWYYSQPNAVDAHGVLEHVREKGYATNGLTPLAAVKKMLREENDKVLKNVEDSRHVTVEPMDFTRFTYAKAHYDRISAEEPRVVSANSKEIIGVLKNTNGKYRLIDGHHRLKWAMNNGKTAGTFIVLY